MQLLLAARYLAVSTLFGVSLFLSLRLIFAHDMRREVWRSAVKHRFYVNQQSFRRISVACGWFLFFIALCTAFLEIEHTLGNQ